MNYHIHKLARHVDWPLAASILGLVILVAAGLFSLLYHTSRPQRIQDLVHSGMYHAEWLTPDKVIASHDDDAGRDISLHATFKLSDDQIHWYEQNQPFTNCHKKHVSCMHEPSTAYSDSSFWQSDDDHVRVQQSATIDPQKHTLEWSYFGY